VTVVGMKDVIVIDTPDALLVTRVGHCQSVKKVAEYLKNGKRIEAEQHLAVRPKNHATAYGGMAPLFQSDSLEMVSATIKPGETLLLDAVDNREVMVSRGELVVSTLKSNTPLAQGQRMDLVNSLPTLLVNPSQDEVEVILVTLLGPRKLAATEATEAFISEVVPLYA
jgi:mannose-1-phosphate guanylyltransferase / mannose-6-phosphate isomerase